MNLLHVIPSFHPSTYYGGAIVSTWHLVSSLADNNHHILVLTTNADGPTRTIAARTDCQIHLGQNLRVRYCRRCAGDSISPTLLALLPQCVKAAQVIHLTAVYSFPTIPTLWLSKVFHKPVVWSPRGSLQRWAGSTKPRVKLLWEYLCQFAGPKRVVIHATSAEEAKESQEHFPDVRVEVIPNGVVIPDTVNHVTHNGILRLLFLGRLHPKKGIENLFEACKTLKSTLQRPFSLIVAGIGQSEYMDQLRAKIRTLGLSDCVSMVGEVQGEPKRRLFEQVDLLIAPSFTENFGMVVAEALAHGVPAIASKGMPWSRLQEYKCGMWVDNDPETLAHAVMKMSCMPLQEMGERGREWMGKEFSWETLSKRMERLYEELISKSR